MRTVPFLILLAACTVQRGSGVAATETRSFGATDAIAVASFLDVDIELGADIQAIDVTCDDNLLEHIVTEIDGGVLRIRTRQGTLLKPRTACTASVKLPTLRRLTVSGSGSATVAAPIEDLERVSVSGSGSAVIDAATGCDVELEVSGSGSLTVGALEACTVTTNVSGSGDIQVAGHADEVASKISGSGTIRAESLEAIALDASVSGSGDLYGFASVSADVRITGSGSVHLFGDATDVDSDITGSGRLTRD